MDTEQPDTASPPAVPESAQAAHNFWKDLDLDGLKRKLDAQGMALAQAQEASLKSRKQLAENTKGMQLRKSLPKEVTKGVGPLLKAYQEEIDRLTQRAKSGEGAFLDLYRQLYDAPDPAPCLATALDATQRVAVAEARAARLGRELAEYKQESASLRNQDLTIRRLEEKVRSLESAAEQREQQARASAQAAEEEVRESALAEARAAQRLLEDDLAAARAEAEALRRAHAAAQSRLLETQGRGEEEREKLRAELEVSVAELERMQARLAFLESEHEQALQRRQEERERLTAQTLDRSDTEQALREELAAHRELVGRLQGELRAAKEDSAAARGLAERDVRAARSELAAQRDRAAELEAALAARPTPEAVAELRAQVRALQGLGPEEEGGAEGAGRDRGPDDVIAALAERNKHLEHELTLARRAADEAAGAQREAEQGQAELLADLEASRALVNRMEEDLLVAQRQYGAAGPPPRQSSASSSSSPAAAAEASTPAPPLDDPSLVAVLGSQRDRFRTRTRELEEQALVTQQELARLRREVEQARADNLAVVERLKYVQSYGREQPGDAERGAEVVGRYLKQYEEGVNPFSAFRQRERTHAARNLPLTDRAAYRLTATMASSRFARFALLAYALLLHCVIFFVMARGVHSEAAVGAGTACEGLIAAGGLAGPGNGTAAIQAALRHVDPVTGGAS